MIVVGRFPIYTNFEPTELSGNRKWEYVLGLISKVSVPLAEFIEDTSDPILRLIGPFKAKKSKSMIILSSPVSALFKILFSEFPKMIFCTTSLKSRLVEIATLEDLFMAPSEFRIEFQYPTFDFEFIRYYFEKFIGIKPTVDYEFLFIKKRNDGKSVLKIRTLNSDTSAMVKFLRYLCIGDKYNYSDVKLTSSLH